MRPATKLARTPLVGPGLVLALALAGCGSDETTTPNPVPTATPTPAPTPTPAAVVAQGGDTLPVLQVLNFDFTTAQAGTVEVTVDYTYADSQVLVWLTDRQCSPQFFQQDRCDYLTKSLSGSDPRVLRATGVAAGTYSVFVANDGPRAEQLTWRVTLAP
jgi:hypothetical protein